MKKTVIITGLVVVVTLIGLMAFVRGTTGDSEMLNFAEAQQGGFEISVSASGELVPEESLDIKGPDIVRNRNFRTAGIAIVDIVPEGTEVKKGDYIATLDRSNFNNNLKDEMDELKAKKSDVDMKLLDTAVVLSTLRDEIRNQAFAVEEAGIALEQSEFEPPAVQRRAELALDRAKRLLEQKKKTYNLRYSQTLSELRNMRLDLARQQSKVDDFNDILGRFTITAPSDGMVVYKKDRLGNKYKVGSIVNPWNMTVATLPDLTSLLSKTYISEIEVSKIKPGQQVNITIDALQGKTYMGEIASIANIGEQLTNSDSKVFEVMVKINDSDPDLRPSMTTSNKILIRNYDDVVYVPAESVHAGADSIPFVYTKDGDRQIVVLGESNDKNIIVEKGLEPGTSVWLSTPDDPEKFTLAGLDLVPFIREREKARRIEMETIGKEDNLITESASPKSQDGNPGAAGTVVAPVSAGSD